MPQAQYQFLLDLANTKFQTDLISCGLAAQDQPSTYDITNTVMEASVRRGRDNELDPFGPGSMTLLLDNTDWRFTPDYGASPLYGKLRPGAMVTARVPVPDYTGLVSWWTLDEESASTRYDSYGTNHLSVVTTGTVNAATGHVGNGARVGSTDALQVSSNSTIQAGDTDFSVACWVKLETSFTSGYIASKSSGVAGGDEWVLWYDSNRFKFIVYTTGGAATTVTASTFGAPVAGTWYFLCAFHDSVNNVIGISVNNGTIDTSSYSSGVCAGSAALVIGAYDGGAFSSDKFTVDNFSFWRRVLPSVTVANVITTLLYDTFTDTNSTLLTAHTPNTGGPWTDLTAAMQIQSGFARRSGAANPPFTVAECGYADVSGTATVKTSAFRQVEIILRATNASNMWRLFLTDNGTTQIIYEFNAGVATVRASAAPSITAGTAYNLTFSASGNTITFTVDGLSTISYASASFNNTATKHGVASNTDTNGAGIDVIQITG